MEGISERNTKAEILAAYANILTENAGLKQQLATPAPAPTGLAEEELFKVNSLAKELSDLKIEKEELKLQIEYLTKPLELSILDRKVSVVIPYVGKLAQGNELILALRGWAENFKEDFNMVVIGSGIPELSDLVHVIECDRVGNNPPVDIAHKMLLAIESDVVTEKFIWANDDQYLISPCMLPDFETLKCSGRLGQTTFGSNLYQQNKAKTFNLLQKAGRGTWDFSTHIPVVFEKSKLKDLIEKLALTREAYLISTLYFNWFFPGFVPYACDNQAALEHDNIKIGVYRKAADMERLKKLMPGKKLISNSESGWTKDLADIMNKRFPSKCRFEK